MGLFIRRGTTKTFVFNLESGNTWTDMGSTYVRLMQSGTTIDKTLSINESDETIGTVTFTQDETLTLKENTTAQLQLFSVSGTDDSEVAAKSSVYDVSILKSLWNEAIHNE